MFYGNVYDDGLGGMMYDGRRDVPNIFNSKGHPTWADKITKGKWRYFAKGGSGTSYSRQRSEEALMAYVCLPNVAGGVEFAFHARLSLPAGTDVLPRLWKTYEKVVRAVHPELYSDAPPPPYWGKIQCPSGFKLETINSTGGKLCVSGTHKEDPKGEAYGPFTSTMQKKCESWGGGIDTCYKKNNWIRRLAENAYGTGNCPDGATQDAFTGYCVEGNNAFGPFPPELIELCQCDPDASEENRKRGCQRGGSACLSARWSLGLLKTVYQYAHQ